MPSPSSSSPADWAVVTIASQRYLPLARVTARTFREHNPDIPFYVVLTDENQPEIHTAMEPFHLLQFDELKIPEPDRFRFQHEELELSYAATPFAILHLLTLGHAKVLFLKQETIVLGPLSGLMDSLDGHSALLTPHFLEPLQRKDAKQWELNVLRAGVFNGGVLGFANDPEAMAFLSWWGGRTAAGCYRDIPRGLHFEQRWLDFATSLMPHCHICRDPGVNVGHWNLLEREVKYHDGMFTANGHRCSIFRFSGYQYERPDQVTRYNSNLVVDRAGDAAKIVHDYHRRLQAEGYEEAQQLSYAWNSFRNGEPITTHIRRLYHSLGDEAHKFGNPFETEEASSFFSWLQQLPKQWK